jgi:hypothetical protein
MTEEIRCRLIAKIEELRATQCPIGNDSQIYYDLRLSGVDFNELLGWVAMEFGTKILLRKRYCPGEGGDWIFLRPLFWHRRYSLLKRRRSVEGH